MPFLSTFTHRSFSWRPTEKGHDSRRPARPESRAKPAILFLTALALFSLMPASARSGDNEWTPSGGPIYGGSGTFLGFPSQLVIDPQTPTTLYTGRSDQGIYKSTDGGATWSWIVSGTGSNFEVLRIDPQGTLYNFGGPLFGGGGTAIRKSTDGGATWNTLPVVSKTTDLAIDPQTPTTLYAGTYSLGIFKSTDGGATWNFLGLSGEYNHRGIVVDPLVPTTVYTNTNFGVHKSIDGGTTWSVIGFANSPIFSNPHDLTELYVSTNQTILKSTDGGATFTEVTANSSSIIGIRFDPQNPNTIYALPSQAPCNTRTLFKSSESTANSWLKSIDESTHGGATFTEFTANSSSIFGIPFDPQNPNTIYALPSQAPCNTRGLFKSSESTANSWLKSIDGGGTWSPIAAIGWIHPLVLDPQDSNTLYASAGGGEGVYKTTDGGASWSASNIGLPASLLAMVIHPTTPPTWYAAAFYGNLYKSTDRGVTWSMTGYEPDCTGGTNLNIPPFWDLHDPNKLWKSEFYNPESSQWPTLDASLDGGDTWIQYAIEFPVNPASYVQDPHDVDTWYCGGELGFYKTIDAGATWSYSSSGLDSLDVHSIVCDPQTPGTIYVGMKQQPYGPHRYLFKSTDGGASWSEVASLFEGRREPFLLIDPQTPSTLYALTKSGSYDALRDLQKSIDSGATWTRLLELSGNAGLSIDQRTPTTLYLTGNGQSSVSRSADGGLTWNTLENSELPGLFTTMVESQSGAAQAGNCSPTVIYGSTSTGLYEYVLSDQVDIQHTPVPSPHPAGSLDVVAQITTQAAGGCSVDPASVFVDYSVNDGPMQRIPMVQGAGASFSVSIPLEPFQEIAYRIGADDDCGYCGTSPIGLEAEHVMFSVRPLVATSVIDTPGLAGNVAVSGGLAFVADAASGLQVIDVSDPTAPSLVGSYPTPNIAVRVAVSGNLAFVVDSDDGLLVIDVSDPAAPVLSATYPANLRNVAASGDQAFICGNDLQVLDVSDPTAPVLTDTFETSGPGNAVAVSGGLAFVACENNGLDVFDLSNPPYAAGTIAMSGNPADVAVSGNLAFVAVANSSGVPGLQVVDVTNPALPVLVGSYDTPGAAIGVAVSGDLVFVADNAEGLLVLDVSDPTAPAYAWEYETTDYSRDVAVSAGLAFVADYTNGLQVIDFDYVPLSSNYVDAVAASGPVLYWSFEEASVNPAQDRITKLAANALVPQQGATREPGLPGLGSAASFNGTSDFAQTQPRFYAGALSLGGPTVFDHYAIEMWVKLNSGAGIQYLLEASSGAEANAPSLIHGFVSNAGEPALEYYSTLGRTGETGPTALNDNQWHHVVVEANVTANTHTIYIDGSEALQAPVASVWRLPFLGVGATAYWDGFHGTNGLIDELALYDLSGGSVTGSDIAGHYFVMFPIVTQAPTTPELPARSALHPAVPNPFNPSTTIRFDLAQAGQVDVSIYDLAGRRVRTLVREERVAGRHEVVWHGRDNNGKRVASGVYLYRLGAGSYVETRKMMLLK